MVGWKQCSKTCDNVSEKIQIAALNLYYILKNQDSGPRYMYNTVLI